LCAKSFHFSATFHSEELLTLREEEKRREEKRREEKRREEKRKNVR
jgi:hypothetical protein